MRSLGVFCVFRGLDEATGALQAKSKWRSGMGFGVLGFYIDNSS